MEAMAKRGQGMGRGFAYHRVLWPTDFSPLSKVALPHAVKVAAGSGAELIVLHVLPSAALYVIPEISAAAWQRIEQENRAVGTAELQRILAQIKRGAPKLRARSLLAEGLPFREVLRAAQRLRCDLIVIATHGRTGLAHMVMGSVAENVVRRAPCPVLTVRPEASRLRKRR
jgi:nucleotide-binding universal stress UspA family protein